MEKSKHLNQKGGSLMKKKKIHIMITLSMFINSLAMALFTLDNIQRKNIAPSITFGILCIFLASLGVYAIVRNAKIARLDMRKEKN